MKGIIVLLVVILFPILSFAFTDEEIVNNISAKVSAVEGIKPYELQIDATFGDVELQGKVDSELKRDQIEEIARSTRGVKGVENNLRVAHIAPVAGVSEAPKCAEARMAIDKSEKLNGYNVTLDCESDRAILRGTVAKASDATEIESIVEKVLVGSNIVNQLRMPPELSDTYLEQAVKEELARRNFDLSGLRYTVTNGIVTFEGEVDNHEKIDAILGTVEMIKGLKDIRSNVKVSGYRPSH